MIAPTVIVPVPFFGSEIRVIIVLVLIDTNGGAVAVIIGDTRDGNRAGAINFQVQVADCSTWAQFGVANTLVLIGAGLEVLTG